MLTQLSTVKARLAILDGSKITNNLQNWGFVFRLTDPQGRPLRNVQFSLSPE